MKQTRKFLSLLLALVLCLGLLPMTALADDELKDMFIITDTRGANTSKGDSSGGDSQQSFTVTFDACDGKFADGTSKKFIKSTADGVPFTEVPTTQSGIFSIWVDDDGKTWTPEQVPGMHPTKDITLSAMWKIAIITDNVGEKNGGGSGSNTGNPDEKEKPKGPFQVTFNANGGKFSNGKSQVVLTTTTGDDGYQVCGANIPEDPTREGYIFDGWDNTTYPASTFASPGHATDANIKSLFATFPIVQNLKMQARWKAASGANVPAGMVITLDPAGGKVSPTKLTMDNAGKVTQPLPTPTRDGYEFAGWYLGDWKVEQDMSYTGPNTLTAHWTKPGLTEQKSVRVDFDPNGGVIKSIKGHPAADIFPASKLAQDNGIFVDKNSGRGMMTTDEYGQLDSLPVAEREGYTLDGWYQGSTKVTEKTVFKADARLEAKWTKGSSNGPFTVKFELGYDKAPKTEIPKDQTVAKGKTVSLPDGKKLTPPTGCEFYAWCILNDKDGKLYPWKAASPVTADMTLVAGWVKKGATVKEGEALPKASETPAATDKPAASDKPAFTDVPATSPFAPAIAWAVEQGITNGTTPTSFSPGTTCSTGHILTFLWRANGSPEPTIENPYKDEIPNAFKKAAIWAHEKGLVSGDTFGSAVPCTRAASVTYMWKLAGGPEAKAASFKDVAATSDYAKAISWAVEKGVTKGTGDGTTFSPENICTRGQIVTFLYRAYAG